MAAGGTGTSSLTVTGLTKNLRVMDDLSVSVCVRVSVRSREGEDVVGTQSNEDSLHRACTRQVAVIN